MTDQEVDLLVTELEQQVHQFGRYERTQIREARQKLDEYEPLTFDELYDLKELAERL